MKQFLRNSILALLPYISIAVICGLVFGHFIVFLLLAIIAFIISQLLQLYYLQKWCGDQSTPLPSVGLNRIWKNLYLLLETRIYDKQQTSEVDTDQLCSTAQGDYGIILLKENSIEWFNQQATVLLKLNADKDSGSDINHLLRSPIFMAALNAQHYGREIILEDRQPPLAICLLPYGAKHLCMVVRDLSRYKEATDTNRELIANIAHELRSPLTVIHGYVEMLKNIDMKTENEDLKQMLDNMQTQVMRMKELTDDTLNVAYLENTELRERDQSSVDVPAMLDSILNTVQIDAPSCRFNTQIEDFHLYGSSSELHSVFHNLIDNAKRHSQSAEIKIVWRRDEQGAYLEVIDSGIGIAADHLPKLSNRFYQVNPARSRAEMNTGLGLAIVKHVLHRHQATLEIESELGSGSIFRCCFPLARVKA